MHAPQGEVKLAMRIVALTDDSRTLAVAEKRRTAMTARMVETAEHIASFETDTSPEANLGPH